jgi:hypothetical protein
MAGVIRGRQRPSGSRSHQGIENPLQRSLPAAIDTVITQWSRDAPRWRLALITRTFSREAAGDCHVDEKASPLRVEGTPVS